MYIYLLLIWNRRKDLNVQYYEFSLNQYFLVIMCLYLCGSSSFFLLVAALLENLCQNLSLVISSL